MKSKLDSMMARLDRLFSEEDSDNPLWGDNEHRQSAKLFEQVTEIDSGS